MTVSWALSRPSNNYETLISQYQQPTKVRMNSKLLPSKPAVQSPCHYSTNGRMNSKVYVILHHTEKLYTLTLQNAWQAMCDDAITYCSSDLLDYCIKCYLNSWETELGIKIYRERNHHSKIIQFLFHVYDHITYI